MRPARLLWSSIKKFMSDQGFFLASGITFNVILSLIPLILLFLSLSGRYLYTHAEIVVHIKNYLHNALPNLDPKIEENIFHVIQHRRISGALGLFLLAWTSIMVFGTIRASLNMIFKVEGRGFVHGMAVDLGMTMAVGVFLMASMLLTSGVTFIQHFHLPFLPDIGSAFGFVLQYVLPYFFSLAVCLLVYKVAPNCRISTSSAFKAAVFSSLFWEVAKQLFHWYAFHSKSLSILYGSLSTVALLILWLHYSSIIFLLGGEVAYFLEQQPQGKRGRKAG